jgi:hypothetical protein
MAQMSHLGDDVRKKAAQGRPLGEIPARYRTGFAFHIYLFAGYTNAAREVWLSRWCQQLVSWSIRAGLTA